MTRFGPNAHTRLTLDVSVAHIFPVLCQRILEILCCFEFDEGLSTGPTLFGIGKAHAVHFPNDVTVCA